MTDQTPSPQELKSRLTGVFSRSAPLYDSVIPFFGTFAAKLVDVADLQPGERVLDVACGRGACLWAAAERVGEAGSLVGTDLAGNMVAALQEQIAAEGAANVSAAVMDAEQLDFPDQSFDVVLCGFGVFFFPDYRRAFAEMRRVLRPGGRLAASTFGTRPGYPWMKEVADAVGKQGQGIDSPVAATATFEQELEAAGFVDVHTTPIDSRFVFPDVDAFVNWHWSHGGRGLLEQLDEDGLETFRRESERRLRQHAVDGGYELVQDANATVARRP